ncbi:hypothetical protein FH972_005277 [Carpinus fangiana]|uniref:RRM domain-containing protein n=1 Tax=Carpinus fangiana TaxID=176857 RepID=A0A5N6QSA2_9ROSI|nr:hypothetical protein FH972_005277 [Carpinus fangiana]
MRFDLFSWHGIKKICLKANERDVYEFFSRAGKVRDVRLIMDRNSRRSKGVGAARFDKHREARDFVHFGFFYP